MSKYAFINGKCPTPDQLDVAKRAGIELVHVGGADQFTVSPGWVAARCPDAIGVVVNTPMAALRLEHEYKIGVFQSSDNGDVLWLVDNMGRYMSRCGEV